MTRNHPRICPGCRTKPVATSRSDLCYDCMPDGPHVPPRCRDCGSDRDYYSSGLCRLCHHFAPQPPGSCRDCHAWGVTRRGNWLCKGCTSWRARPEHYPVATCPFCEHRRPTKPGGTCRLCWRQTVAERVRRHAKYFPAAEANRHGQQLYFALPTRNLRAAGPRSTAAVTSPTRFRWSTGRRFCSISRATSPRAFAVPFPSHLTSARQPSSTTSPFSGRHSTAGRRAPPTASVRASGSCWAPRTRPAHRSGPRTSRPLLDQTARCSDRQGPGGRRPPGGRPCFRRGAVVRPEDRRSARPMAEELRTWFDILLNGSSTLLAASLATTRPSVFCFCGPCPRSSSGPRRATRP